MAKNKEAEGQRKTEGGSSYSRWEVHQSCVRSYRWEGVPSFRSDDLERARCVHEDAGKRGGEGAVRKAPGLTLMNKFNPARSSRRPVPYEDLRHRANRRLAMVLT